MSLPVRSQLRENYVGAILVALLLSGSLKAVIKVVEAPVASILVRVINYIHQRSYPVSSGLRLPDVPPLGFTLLYIATASSLLLIGCLIAFWLYPAGTAEEHTLQE